MLDQNPNLSLPPDTAPAFLTKPRPVHRHQRGKNARKKPPQRGLGVAQLEKLRLEEESKHGQECLASLHHLEYLMPPSLCPSQQVRSDLDNSSAFFDSNGTASLPAFSYLARSQSLSSPYLHIDQGVRDNQAQYTSILRPSILPCHGSAAMVPELYMDRGVCHNWARLNEPFSTDSSVLKDGRRSTIAFVTVPSFETSLACNTSISSCHSQELSSFQNISLCPSLAWSESRDRVLKHFQVFSDNSQLQQAYDVTSPLQPCNRKRPRMLSKGHETTLEPFKLVDLNASVDDESKDQDDSATGCCIAGARSGSWGSLLKASPSNSADVLGLSRPERYGCTDSQRMAVLSSTRFDSDYLTIGTPFLTRSSGVAVNPDAACIGNGPRVDEFLTLAPSWCLTQNYGCSAARGIRTGTTDILDDSAASCYPRGKGPTTDYDRNLMSCMQDTQTGCSYTPCFELLWNEDENYADHRAQDEMLTNVHNGMVDLELRLSL